MEQSEEIVFLYPIFADSMLKLSHLDYYSQPSSPHLPNSYINDFLKFSPANFYCPFPKSAPPPTFMPIT
ncbi:hypothetical protein ACTXT7_013768 [Hymenolepis weldensis]